MPSLRRKVAAVSVLPVARGGEGPAAPSSVLQHSVLQGRRDNDEGLGLQSAGGWGHVGHSFGVDGGAGRPASRPPGAQGSFEFTP